MGTDFLHLLRQHKQTDDSCHLEGQRQQIHENISTWKLSSKALTVLTWKYEAGPSLSQNSGKKPGHYEVTSAVAVPAPQALQRFKKAAQHHILKLWLEPKIPVEAFLMHLELACQFLLGDSALPCVMKIRKDRRLSALDCRGVARLDGNTAAWWGRTHFPVVEWLGFGAFIAVACVRFSVRQAAFHSQNKGISFPNEIWHVSYDSHHCLQMHQRSILSGSVTVWYGSCSA